MKLSLGLLFLLLLQVSFGQSPCPDVDYPGFHHVHYDEGGAMTVKIDLQNGVDYSQYSPEDAYPRQIVSSTAHEFLINVAAMPDKPCQGSPPTIYTKATITEVKLEIKNPVKPIPIVVPGQEAGTYSHSLAKRVRWQTNAFGYQVNPDNQQTTQLNDVTITLSAKANFIDSSGNPVVKELSTTMVVKPYNAYSYWKTSFDFEPSTGLYTYSQVSGAGAAKAYKYLGQMRYKVLNNPPGQPFIPNRLDLVNTSGQQYVPKSTVVFAFTHGEPDGVFSSAPANAPVNKYKVSGTNPPELVESMLAKGLLPPTRYIFHYACSTLQTAWQAAYLTLPSGGQLPFPNNSFVVGFPNVVYSTISAGVTDPIEAKSRTDLNELLKDPLWLHAERALTLLFEGKTISEALDSANTSFMPRYVHPLDPQNPNSDWIAEPMKMIIEDGENHQFARLNSVYWLPTETNESKGTYYVVFPIQ